MSLGFSCVKYLLFFANLIFVMMGITILVIGGVLHGIHEDYQMLVTDNYIFLPYILLTTGSITSVIAFFGCCGTLKQNHCMILTFSTLLLIVLVLEIVAAVAVYFYYNDVKAIIEKKLNESLPFYFKDPELKKTWDLLQYNFKCCGVHGPEDYGEESPPASCCKYYKVPNGPLCGIGEIYEDGCIVSLQYFIEQHALVLYIVAIVLMLVQILGVGFACCLAQAIRKGYETV